MDEAWRNKLSWHTVDNFTSVVFNYEIVLTTHGRFTIAK